MYLTTTNVASVSFGVLHRFLSSIIIL